MGTPYNRRQLVGMDPESGFVEWTASLAGWLADNNAPDVEPPDPDDVKAVKGLKVGQSVVIAFGGGGGGMRILRVPDAKRALDDAEMPSVAGFAVGERSHNPDKRTFRDQYRIMAPDGPILSRDDLIDGWRDHAWRFAAAANFDSVDETFAKLIDDPGWMTCRAGYTPDAIYRDAFDEMVERYYTLPSERSDNPDARAHRTHTALPAPVDAFEGSSPAAKALVPALYALATDLGLPLRSGGAPAHAGYVTLSRPHLPVLTWRSDWPETSDDHGVVELRLERVVGGRPQPPLLEIDAETVPASSEDDYKRHWTIDLGFMPLVAAHGAGVSGERLSEGEIKRVWKVLQWVRGAYRNATPGRPSFDGTPYTGSATYEGPR